jgi:predicted nucleotidyltransferase
MENVKDILKEIEQKKNIEILYACETGSRAWGFPSPDSDYDVRFIYKHKIEWYLSLSHKKDTIEFMSGDLDVNGWDLRKCLMLLKKSNAPLIERFQSPIEYYSNNDFKEKFKDLIKSYFSPTAVFYHHYSLAKKFWEEVKNKESFKLKNYFYLMRSLLSCNWIAKDKSVLPMHIEGLMKYINEDQKKLLRGLIELKSTVGEKYLHPKDESLNAWIDELFEFLEPSKENLGVSKTDFSHLTDFFLKKIYEGVDNRLDKS